MKIEQSGENLAKVLWYYNIPLDKKIICPFHEDVNPSMSVNYETGIWSCFGCGEAGNDIKFVKLMEDKLNKLNDLQSLKRYYKILKSDKCSDIKLSKHLVIPKKPKRELYNQAYDYYHGLKKIDWRNPSEPEQISAADYMTERGFKLEILNSCGAKTTYNKSYGIVFPMIDNGKFKGWVCRTMIKDLEKKRKYLYNEGFSRATTLVGDYGNKDYVIVVEGYMDRLKFIQFGKEQDNVVAILGWKMSDLQIKKLKDRGVTRIISALDNDICGKKGTKYLEGFFDVTRFTYLKGVKDPGEMTEKSFSKMFSRTMKLLNKEK